MLSFLGELMREMFPGHYSPTADQYADLWGSGTIVLDANLLLDLYRLPGTARDDLFSVLESVGDRIWVPHQVALEFQRNRLTVIAAGKKNTESVLDAARGLTDQLRAKVESLEIDRRGLGVNAEPLIAGLQEASVKLMEVLGIVHDSQVDISTEDSVRDRLDRLLSGKVGPGPKTQAELDDLVSGGEQRYADKIPPGYEDAEKSKDPQGGEFIHGRIKYQKKFGDLIVWRQIIKHATEARLEKVIFVTSDRKPDWWQLFKGKVLGPHPELVMEISTQANVSLFWMYTLDNFVESAKKYTSTKISENTVEHIRSVSEPDFASENLTMMSTEDYFSSIDVNKSRWMNRTVSGAHSTEVAVERWLSESKGEVLPYYGRFPDFLVNRGGVVFGYEVKNINEFSIDDVSSVLHNIIMTQTPMRNVGLKFSKLSVVFVVSFEVAANIYRNETNSIQAEVERALRNSPTDEIVVGYVHMGEFVPWVEATRFSGSRPA